MCFSYIVLEKKRIVGILEPITSFHKNMDRRTEIAKFSYRYCRQIHTYINIKLYIHNYMEWIKSQVDMQRSMC